jgi:hypothetical protein
MNSKIQAMTKESDIVELVNTTLSETKTMMGSMKSPLSNWEPNGQDWEAVYVALVEGGYDDIAAMISDAIIRINELNGVENEYAASLTAKNNK